VLVETLNTAQSINQSSYRSHNVFGLGSWRKCQPTTFVQENNMTVHLL